MRQSEIKPIISIIVPVYNVKDYLESCVKSLLSQTYKNTEILLINDGSFDGSENLCDKLAKKHENIKVVHKENEGLSSARNMGIDIAKGEFLSFVDSDDTIEDDMLEILHSNMLAANADISICGYRMVYSDKIIPICEGDKKVVYDNLEALSVMFRKKNIGIISCNKLFKKVLFNKIRFPEGQFFEDVNTIYKLIEKASLLVYDPICKYNYVQRQDSINGNNFKSLNFNEGILDLYYASHEVFEYISKNHSEIIYPILIGTIEYHLRVINQIIIFGKYYPEILCDTKNLIKHNYKRILLDTRISIKFKVQITLYCYFKSCYKLLLTTIKQKRR